MSVRSYDPEGRWVQPDPSQQEGVHTYVYANDDPVDATDGSGSLTCSGSHDFWSWLGDTACRGANAVGGGVHAVYQFAVGDDLKTLSDDHARGIDKFFAVVDLTSNVLTFIPIVGEGVDLARAAAKVGFKLARHEVAREVGYQEAVADIKQLARRGAQKAASCIRCFPATTLVAVPGGLRAIKSLHVGDQVLSEDPHSGKVEAEQVEAVIADPVSPLIALDLSDGSTITVTADHPFWVDAGRMLLNAGWLPAGQLRAGDRLRTASRTGVLVVGVRRHVGFAAVYTLTVAKDHSFFAGTASVLVHNAVGCSSRTLGARLAKLLGYRPANYAAHHLVPAVINVLHLHRVSCGSMASQTLIRLSTVSFCRLISCCCSNRESLPSQDQHRCLLRRVEQASRCRYLSGGCHSDSAGHRRRSVE